MLQDKLIAADAMVAELEREKAQREFLESVGERPTPELVEQIKEDEAKLPSPTPSEVASAQQAQIEQMEQQIAKLHADLMSAMADGSATENWELKKQVQELEERSSKQQSKITELTKAEENVEIEKVSGDQAVSVLAADREREIVALENDLLKKTEELQGLQDYVDELQKKVPTPSKSRKGSSASSSSSTSLVVDDEAGADAAAVVARSASEQTSIPAGVHMVSITLDEDEEDLDEFDKTNKTDTGLVVRNLQKELAELNTEMATKDFIIVDLNGKLANVEKGKEDEMAELEAALEKVNDELDESALSLQKKSHQLDAAVSLNEDMRARMEALNEKMMSLEETEGL